MSIYHLSMKAISRSSGRTASGSAAYRAAEKIIGALGEVHDYSRKKGVSFTEIFLPQGVESWGRQKLWNEADKIEKRKNSTVAREYEIALPAEITTREREELASEFARYIVDSYGVCADVAIHEPRGKNKNYHMHVLTSTRVLTGNGFGAKTRILDAHDTGREEINKIRSAWERMINNVLEKNGVEKVSCLSLSEQGIDRLPQIHVGVSASAMERKGLVSERGERNRARKEISAKAQEIAKLEEELAGVLEREAAAPVNRVAAEVANVRLPVLPTPAALPARSPDMDMSPWSELEQPRKVSPELVRVRAAPAALVSLKPAAPIAELRRGDTHSILNTEAQKIAEPEFVEAGTKEVKAEKADAIEKRMAEGIEKAKARFAEYQARRAREAEEKRRQEAEIERRGRERQAAEKRAREMELEQKREEERQKRIERDRKGGWSR